MAAVTQTITRTARTGASDIQIAFAIDGGALTASVRFVSDDSDGEVRDGFVSIKTATVLSGAEQTALVATLKKLRDAAISQKGFA